MNQNIHSLLYVCYWTLKLSLEVGLETLALREGAALIPTLRAAVDPSPDVGVLLRELTLQALVNKAAKHRHELCSGV